MALVRAHGKKWQVIWYENRQQRRKSFATEDEARSYGALIGAGSLGVRLSKLGSNIGRKQTPIVSEYARLLIETGDMKPTSRDTYRQALRNIEGTNLGNAEIGQVERDTTILREFLAGLKTNRATVTALLSKVFNAAIRERHISISPFKLAGIRRARPNGRSVRPLSVEEVEHLARTAERGRSGAQTALAIRLAGFAGLRAGEIGGLKATDIHHGDPCWLSVEDNATEVRGGRQIGTPKGNHSRQVPIDCDLADEASRYVAANRPRTSGPTAGRIFRSTQGGLFTKETFGARMDTVCRKAGVARVKPHDLRHTYASLLLEAGAHIEQIQKALGHADIETTARYLSRFPSADKRVADTMANIRRAAR